MEPTKEWLQKAQTPIEWLERAFEIKQYAFFDSGQKGWSPWLEQIRNYIDDSNECRMMVQEIDDHPANNFCLICRGGTIETCESMRWFPEEENAIRSEEHIRLYNYPDPDHSALLWVGVPAEGNQ